MSQDAPKPQESAPVFLLLFVGFIVGLCVGFMTKDYVVRTMIGMMPKSAIQTDQPPLPDQGGVQTPEIPAIVPEGQDVVPPTAAPEGEGTPEEKTEEEKKEEPATPEGATPAESTPAAEPATPVAPVAE